MVFLILAATMKVCGQKLDSLLRKKLRFEKSQQFETKDTSYIKLLIDIAFEEENQYPDSIGYYGTRILELSESLQFKEGIAAGNLFLGRDNVKNGRYPLAKSQLNKSIEFAFLSGAHKIEMNAHNQLGIISCINANYPEAYTYFQKGILFSRKYNLYEQEQILTLNLAYTFELIGDLDNAEEHYKSVLSALENSENKHLKASAETNISKLLIEKNQLNHASVLANKAFDSFKKLKNNRWLAITHFNLGEIARKQNKPKESIKHFQSGLSLVEDTDNIREKMQGLGFLAQAYFEIDDLKGSEENILASLDLARKTNEYQGIMFATDLLHKIYAKKGEAEKALTYLVEAKTISDSIYSSENASKLTMLEAQNNFGLQQERLKLENDKKLNRRTQLVYIFIATILFLLALTFLISNNVRYQKKLSKNLENLNESKDKIFSIIAHDLKSPINTLKELLELYDVEDISEDDIVKSAPRLKANVDHSSFMLNNLLAWANNQMDGIKVKPTAIAIKDKATQVVGLYSGHIEKKDLKVICLTNSKMKVFVDGDHLDLILRNLILNAIKFTPNHGQISFNGTEVGNRIIFEINDNGIGMNANLISSILEGASFKPLPGTENEKGTGIGIQLTKELVLLNKGKMEIDSIPNVGTTVRLNFPKA